MDEYNKKEKCLKTTFLTLQTRNKKKRKGGERKTLKIWKA